MISNYIFVAAVPFNVVKAAISSSILFRRFLPSILSTLTSWKESGKLLHLTSLMMEVVKKSFLGDVATKTEAVPLCGLCRTAIRRSPAGLDNRHPVAFPSGSTDPHPKWWVDEDKTCQPVHLARAWIPFICKSIGWNVMSLSRATSTTNLVLRDLA